MSGGEDVEHAVRVTFTLSEEDLRRAIKQLPALRLLTLWGIVIVLLFAVWIGLGPNSDLSLSMLSLVVLLGLTAVFWYFATIIQARRQHRSMKDTERVITYEFTPNGFSSESAGASSRVDYARVHRVVDGKHSLLIYCNPHSAQVVPKRAFAEGDLKIVQGWLHDAVTPRHAKTFLVRTVILWVVLVVVFLAIWQFLAPSSP